MWDYYVLSESEAVVGPNRHLRTNIGRGATEVQTSVHSLRFDLLVKKTNSIVFGLFSFRNC